jgi:hypothetical protein
MRAAGVDPELLVDGTVARDGSIAEGGADARDD